LVKEKAKIRQKGDKTISKNPTVVFVQPRKVVIEEREIPSPQANELLIKTECTLISTGTELTILNGEYPPNSVWAHMSKFPFVPGYSNVGRVIATGGNIDRGWINREVVSHSSHASYVVSPIERIEPIVRPIPKEEAALFELARIAMNGVRRARVQWGEAVVIYGLGLLGQLVARFCWLAGARPIIGTDIAESRLGKLPSKSSIIGINPQKEDIITKVNEFTRSRMADVVFEVTGNPHIIPDEFRLLRRQGRFIILSSPYGTTTFDFHDLCNWPSFTIIGAHNSSHPLYSTLDNPWTKARHAELFFDLIADGELDIDNLITHRISYKKAPDIYQILLKDRSRVMGVVLEWE